MQIRLAREDELTQVGDLTVAAYGEWLDGERDPYAQHLRDAHARAREAELFVAVDPGDATLLGTVTICPEGSPWREIGLAGEGEFRMLAVHPRSRGRGVGGVLTSFCLDRFREVGTPAVVISSLPEMTTAHRIYTRMGFERTPARDWRPYPDTLLITFRKDLAP